MKGSFQLDFQTWLKFWKVSFAFLKPLVFRKRKFQLFSRTCFYHKNLNERCIEVSKELKTASIASIKKRSDLTILTLYYFTIIEEQFVS